MSNLRTILLRSRRLALLTLVCLLPLAWLACKGGGGGGGDEGGGGGGGGGATPLVIPAPGDWTNRGSTGLSASGVLNQWNYRIDGAISPCAAVKRGSTYYLYYIGADGNRSSDGGPRRRALGVATSSNGLSFTNSGNNPVVTHIPNNNQEEGVFSCTAVVDGSNTVLYYGGMTENSSGSSTVSSSGYRLSSGSGTSFSGQPGAKVLDRVNSNIFNFGDEIYPIGVYRNGSAYHLYYTSQGNVDNWALGLASGTTSNFTSFEGLIDPSGASTEIIGGGAVVPDTASSFLLFTLRSFADRVIEVREVPTSDPSDIGNPIAAYGGFPNVQHFTVLLDEADGTWFLYIAELGFIRVYTADVERE